jgi:hypothetical protein
MDPGPLITVLSARASAAIYVIAIWLLLEGKRRACRLWWMAALILHLVHVYCAFEYFYAWSHTIAYRETARETLQLFGLNFGGGLYLNYAFTVLWSADCAWWWANPESYDARPKVVSISLHTFIAFMVVNGTIIVWALRWLAS